MGKQSTIFLSGEGQAWLDRNKEKLPVKDDPVIDTIVISGITPKRVLEVGCANGWRLAELNRMFGCTVRGIDPSVTSLQDIPGGYIKRGVADWIQFYKEDFDMVIYGFCLYLCDPEDYFKIAYEGDRVLADKGHLVVYDFFPDLPHSRPYKHKAGVMTRKANFARLWLSHPHYSRSHLRMAPEETAVSILRKSVSDAFPVVE